MSSLSLPGPGRLTPNGYENHALQEQPEEQEEGAKANKTTPL